MAPGVDKMLRQVLSIDCVPVKPAEHRADTRVVDLPAQSGGVFDPFEPEGDVRIEKQVHAGALRAIQQLQNPATGDLVAAGIRELRIAAPADRYFDVRASIKRL